MVAALDGSVAVDADRATSVSLKIHGARAPPAQRASVNAFLSVVCVWTI
jgi:hypothetical protein